MSVFHLREMSCGRCGHVRVVKAVDSANPMRRPLFLADVQDRTFNRFGCDRCGHVDVLEGPMLWTDVLYNLVAWMLPPIERPLWFYTEPEVHEWLRQPVQGEGPHFVRAWGRGASLRLVFGLEELREKVVAFRAGIDDRVVEALKLPYADCEAASAPVLERVDEEGLLLASAPEPATLAPALARDRAVALIPWDEYERCSQACASSPEANPGLFTGTWVHWLRAAFAPVALEGGPMPAAER